ncbi:MAG TPA: SDR family NAD(P)-dependent oxidoreductase [Burkholderiales bacterium]|nr:SDR family NAD(P)-dependent oxidoreductase [Burkholderiales bacterium]
MSGRLQGKVAVITGGNSGIGLATSELFAGEGAKLAIFGRNAKSLQNAAGRLGPDCLTVHGDVCRIADLDRLYDAVAKRFGRIDVLVANAGVAKFSPVEACGWRITKSGRDGSGSALVARGHLKTIPCSLPDTPLIRSLLIPCYDLRLKQVSWLEIGPGRGFPRSRA